jgi:hypothetical protein
MKSYSKHRFTLITRISFELSCDAGGHDIVFQAVVDATGPVIQHALSGQCADFEEIAMAALTGPKDVFNTETRTTASAPRSRAAARGVRGPLFGAGCALVAALTAVPLEQARADELRMQPIRTRDDLAHPVRGMTMDNVRASYGEPARRQGAVGDPPITRWEYDGFVVYFEYQYVLHTVVKRGR